MTDVRPNFHTPNFCMSNPFGMGFASAQKMNFCLGLAAATSGMAPMPMPMPMPMPIFSSYCMTPMPMPMPMFMGRPSLFTVPPLLNPSMYQAQVPLYGGFMGGGLNNPVTSNLYYNQPQLTLPNYVRTQFELPVFDVTPKQSFSDLIKSFVPAKLSSSSSTATSASDSEEIKVDPALASKIKPGLLKGPLKGKEGVIAQLCQKYNVDIALAVSIICLESGYGTSDLAKHNNFMGYRAAGDLGKNARGFGYFSTPEKGLEAAIRNLSKYPERYASVKKADLSNIDAIGRIYCEGDSYATQIKQIYNKNVKSFLA